MEKINIGNVRFGEEPRIALIIDKIEPYGKLLEYSEKGADLLELRVDCFRETYADVKEYIEGMKSKVDLPLLLTVRETPDNCAKRLGIFKELIPFVNAVDIEIDAGIVADVVACAKEHGAKVLVSEHNFDVTPSDLELDKIVETSLNLGADIVKIATMANSYEDVGRLLSFSFRQKVPFIAISMGQIGKISRIVGHFFGSLYTYTFLGDSVAPGQIPFDETVAEISKLME